MFAIYWFDVSGHAGEKESPFREVGYQEALQLAQRERKWVLIDYYTTWCAPCKRLDRETWNSPKVIDWLTSNTVPIKLDAEKEKALAKEHRVRMYPTILLLDSEGTEKGRIAGFRPPEAFLAEVSAFQSGKDMLTIAREKWQRRGQNNPLARDNYADALADAGKYPEALEHYLWCFDHGLEHKRSYYGVRLSYLLSSIKMLGRKYPPALDALRERRDASQQRILDALKAPEPVPTSEPASSRDAPFLAQLLQPFFEADQTKDRQLFNDFNDLINLNETLGQSERSLELYDRLKEDHPDDPFAATAVRLLIDDLLAARRYKDINDTLNVTGEVENAFRMQSVTGSLGGLFAQDAEQAEEFQTMERKMLINKSADYYQVLLGVDRQEDAVRLAERVLQFDAGAKTYNALAWAGYLTGRATEANLSQAEKAMELSNGESMAILDTYVRILKQLDRGDEALKALQTGKEKITGDQEQDQLDQLEQELRDNLGPAQSLSQSNVSS